jgi:hypothetical protein
MSFDPRRRASTRGGDLRARGRLWLPTCGVNFEETFHTYFIRTLSTLMKKHEGCPDQNN